jgi:hypothetical protein
MRYLFCITLAVAVLGLSCKRAEKTSYVVVHVLRDPSAFLNAQLRDADLEFGRTTHHTANGDLIVVATNEGADSYSRLLERYLSPLGNWSSSSRKRISRTACGRALARQRTYAAITPRSSLPRFLGSNVKLLSSICSS